MADERPCTGLVLPGGGARAAYQAGVLKGIAELLPAAAGNPFPVVSGTSAGAINATVVASHASDFRRGVARLNAVWANFRVEQVYRSDFAAIAGTGLHWLAALLFRGLGKRNPVSLLNNTPLRELLEREIGFDSVRNAIAAGDLAALAVTASGFSSATAVSFFEDDGRHRQWRRARREGRRASLGVDHLMASIAVPFIFPPVKIGPQYFGDGAIREANPLSAAVHLGADRLLVIGVRDEHTFADTFPDAPRSPTFGEIAGYMLDTIFLDGLYSDLERLTRLNDLVQQAPPEAPLALPDRMLKRIDTQIIVPSADIRAIAARHAKDFPRSVRRLLQGVGAFNASGN